MKTSHEDMLELLEMADEAARAEFPLSAVAFRAATLMIKNCDADLMEHLPDAVRNWLQDMINVYKEEGQVIGTYSVGQVDHTELTRKLVAVLEGQVVPAER